MSITKKQAIELLTNGSSHDRFLAARFFEKLADKRDIKLLLRAKAIENDVVVLNWIDRAIEACQKLSDDEKDIIINDSETDDIKSIRAQAVEWVAGMLLHEIGNKLGLIAFYASQEIERFELSATQKHVKNLQLIFDGITELKKSATALNIEQFDLYNLITEISDIERRDFNIDIIFVGIKPFIIESGKQLLSLALSNGIRNAIESVRDMTGDEVTEYKPKIQIIWEETPNEYWVSINDNGAGIPINAASFFKIGKSTKTGHAGFGLAIAKQALETLSGTVELDNSTSGGAKYMIRWRKND